MDASLSVPEFHRVGPSEERLADFTADRDSHPALKTSLFSCSVIIIQVPMENASPFFKNIRSIERLTSPEGI